MPTEPNREETLFAAALRLPAGERAAFLNRECGGDAALRQRVEALLQADEQAGEFLDEPAPGVSDETVGATIGMVRLTEQLGERIGRYQLLEKIGEGGFGDVWMAEQEEPVRRRAALKIIRLGMDRREVVARFEAERQALARANRVLDSAEVLSLLLVSAVLPERIGALRWQPRPAPSRGPEGCLLRNLRVLSPIQRPKRHCPPFSPWA